MVLVAAVATPSVVPAAAYPEKPVAMIVAYSPGGGTDTAARVIAKYVEPYLKQRLIIENKPGAGGQIGFTALSKAKTDGYKIGFINVPSIFMVKMLRKGVPYQMSDFKPIANIQLDPVVLAVNSDSPYQTMEDFIAAAKKAPGQVNVGGDGPQSNNQLQVVVTEDKLGLDVNFVSYNGSGPAITALLGNQVQAAVPSASSILPHVKSGAVRVLAVFGPEPFEHLPGVPTVSEVAGLKVPSVGASMRGIAAPKGMSDEQVAVLEDAFSQAMKDPGFLRMVEDMGLPIKFMGASEFAAVLAAAEEEIKQYIDLLK
jgi:tripartite-type tricarboxylate transporter receptor subunit TctC